MQFAYALGDPNDDDALLKLWEPLVSGDIAAAFRGIEDVLGERAWDDPASSSDGGGIPASLYPPGPWALH